MSHNLIIDWGNTRVKAAVFENGALVKQDAAEKIDIGWLQNFNPDFIQSNVLFCSVTSRSDQMEDFVSRKVPYFLKLSHQSKLPVKTNYKTPDTLGYDRLSNAIAAINRCTTDYALAIDAGTCIKYDLIHRNGGYLGGGISPGLQMRYRALHRDTHALPLIDEVSIPELVGENTVESIRSGVINGALAEIDGLIDRYSERYSSVSVFLTGGDSHVFEKALKNTIFANSFLTLFGLNDILEFNQNA